MPSKRSSRKSSTFSHPTSSSSSPSSSNQIRVISYNLLSPGLTSPSRFPQCHPTHLQSEFRYKLIISKLDYELTSTSIPVIFCLQEVSRSWYSKLHLYFLSKNYTMIGSSYGSQYSDYMGVFIAFPINHPFITLIECRLERIGQFVYKPPYNSSQTNKESHELTSIHPSVKYYDNFKENFKKIMNLSKIWITLCDYFYKKSEIEMETENAWMYSRKRQNVAIFLRFQFTLTCEKFCIGTYHNPCAFWSQSVMLIHSGMVINRMIKFAKNGSEGWILAGDFNIKPSEFTYEFVTKQLCISSYESGHLDVLPKDEESMQKQAEESIEIQSEVDSVYVLFNGKEPDFTNYAKVEENPMFIETLDYIFIGRNQWIVNNVKLLPHRNHVQGPLPNAIEPSDHLMIGADLQLSGNTEV